MNLAHRRICLSLGRRAGTARNVGVATRFYPLHSCGGINGALFPRNAVWTARARPPTTLGATRTFASSSISVISSNDEFKNDVVAASNDNLVLVDCYAEALAPILEKVASGRTDAIIKKVDIDKLPEVATALSVTSIPAVYAFKGGKAVGVRVGLMQEGTVHDFIEEMKKK